MNQKDFANVILVVVVIILLGAVGYFIFVRKSEPIAQQPTPTSTQTETPVSPTPTPTPKDETANWQTYRNEEYGFEFRYPNEWARNDWQVSGRTVLGTDFSSPDYKVRSEYRGGDFPQEIFEKGAQLAIYIDSFAAYSPYTFEELKSDRLKNSKVSKITEIEVAGERALQVLGGYIPENAGVDVYFFSPRNNALLFTVYLKSTIGEKDSYLFVFNQILSTFKFIK